MFVLSSKGDVRTAIFSTIPLNFLNALLVLIGGIAGDYIQYIMWSLAISIQILFPYLRKRRGEYHFVPNHFVERHGLVVIVAIGESIIAIGVGAGGHSINLSTLLSAVTSLVLSFSLWSLYFSKDRQIEHAFSNVPTAAKRREIAFNAFGYAHYVLILGIIVLAVGIKKTLYHPLDALTFFEAFSFGFGVTLFILGNVWFHRTLLFINWFPHIISALVALLTIIFGMHYAIIQLFVLICILYFTIYTHKNSRSNYVKMSRY
ncbi:low temperature requirement protein A [Bacillus cereus]|nr:low temperature requirement protein A [Bacillus cereus]MBJ8025732.1 low temperature requirement protein A [Bacillus cereus]MBJ8038085.1 low temperature requirement protein A [Bacillus cereus]